MPDSRIKGQKASNILDPKYISSALELIGVISIPATVIGFIAAFLGWRTSSAYLLTFGIGPGWMTSDILGLIVNAWVEIALILFIVALFIASQIVVIQVMRRFRPTQRIAILFVLFLVLICLFIYILLRYFVIRGGLSFSAVFFLEGSGLLIWWIFTVAVDQIIRTPTEQFNNFEKKVQNLLSFVFSMRLVVILVTVALCVYFLLNFAVMHGTHFGIRDLGSYSHLPIVDISSNTQLGISNEKVEKLAGKEIYHYDDLRLALKTEDYIFAFYINEVNQENITSKIYIIPLKNIEWLTIRQWDWKPSIPTPNPTPIISPTPP